jgi:hypothetical protein
VTLVTLETLATRRDTFKPTKSIYVNPPSSSSKAFFILNKTPVFQLSNLVT